MFFVPTILIAILCLCHAQDLLDDTGSNVPSVVLPPSFTAAVQASKGKARKSNPKKRKKTEIVNRRRFKRGRESSLSSIIRKPYHDNIYQIIKSGTDRVVSYYVI